MKKFGVERFVEDYKTIEYTNEKGRRKYKTEYIGQWYVPEISEERQRRLHVFLWIASLIAVVSLAGGLLMPYAADSELYVVLPCAVALFPGLYMAMGLLTLPKIGKKMERMVYEHGYLRIGRSALAMLVLVGIGVIGTAVYGILCLTHRIDKNLGAGDAAFLGLMIICTVLSVLLFIRTRNVTISIENNEKNTDRTDV
ncbi:MAG: hypothetical protein II117_03605 [Clostridia bacterium]|nr:hypothetical protein [Clostridia bacterium]